jgi:hypothetical protein
MNSITHSEEFFEAALEAVVVAGSRLYGVVEGLTVHRWSFWAV